MVYILSTHPFDILFHIFVDTNIYISPLTYIKIEEFSTVYVRSN